MKDLLSSFSAPSVEEWLNQIKADLKTEDPQKVLSRKVGSLDMHAAYQEIPEEAFHNTRNRAPISPEFAFAGEWISQVSASSNDLVKTNKRLIKLLEHGAGSVLITGIGISNQEELRLAIRGILPEIAPISFSAGEATPALLFMLIDEFERMQCEAIKIKGCLGWDPLTDFVRYGSFSTDVAEVFNLGRALLRRGSDQLPEYQIIRVNGSVYHNAGANAVQELAAVCSVIADTVVKLESIEPSQVLKQLRVNMSAGSDVFVTISKFRAIRVLWGMLCESFGIREEVSLHLETETALRNKSSLDPYNNLLRCTLETFAAITGGCSEHLVHPYNAHYEEDHFDAALLGLNIQHLLREESRLDKVLDPLSGAPYIENMTEKLVHQAWDLFNNWEEKGGFVASARAGLIQKEIIAQRANTEKEIRTRKRTLVGVNRYADASPAEIRSPLAEKDPLLGLPQIKALEPYFEAMSFESVRKLLCLDKQPQACIFEDGDTKMSRLRADFSADLLASGGIGCIETERIVPLSDRFFSEAAQRADIWVFCSNDANYSAMLSALKQTVANHKTLIIAGNPASIQPALESDQLLYMYSGCDVIDLLHAVLESTELNVN